MAVVEYITTAGDKVWYKDVDIRTTYRTGYIYMRELRGGTRLWYGLADGGGPAVIPHRDDDGPAIIHKDGSRLWYKNGKLHRDNDKPAIESGCGNVLAWFSNGELHREDGPAIIINQQAGLFTTARIIEVFYKNGIHQSKIGNHEELRNTKLALSKINNIISQYGGETSWYYTNIIPRVVSQHEIQIKLEGKS